MSENIIVPALGESITEATISKWIKNQGDQVKEDEPIVELETDKVNVEVPSEGEGTSTLTLSVSNSTNGSSELTCSPICLSHLDTVASVIDSPKAGTKI